MSRLTGDRHQLRSEAAIASSHNNGSILLNAYRLVLGLIIACVCIYVYARSPLRERLENRLFDLRSRLAPTQLTGDSLAIISIDERDIYNIHASLGLPPSKDLQAAALIKLLRVLQQSQAQTIATLLHTQVYALDAEASSKLAELALADPRIIFGIGHQGQKDIVWRALPKPLRQVAEQIGSYEATRSFRRDVIRNMVVKKQETFPYLIERLAARLGLLPAMAQLPVAADNSQHLRLNYFKPKRILTIAASDAIKGQGLDALQSRTVLVGYTAFRPWTLSTLDATHLNSPWQDDGVDVDGSAMPLVVLQAQALGNLQNGIWLQAPPNRIVWIFAIGIILLTCLFWWGGIGLACLLFVSLWTLILGLSALAFAWLHAYLPLADALLASTLIMIVGAALRLRQISKLHAASAALAASQAEIRRIKQRFFDRLTLELISINRSIQKLIDQPLPQGMPADLIDAHRRLLLSAQEFTDYLALMDQQRLSEEAGRLAKNLKSIPLRPLLEAVIRTITIPTEQPSRILLNCPTDLIVLADDYLLSQIIDNLLLNALKYSPPPSPVQIVARRTPTRVVIQVIDEGPGIAAEHRERIFEKYYRINDQGSTQVKGHGLGLYLSRFFAEQMHAQLSLDATTGVGTTFVLSLLAPSKAEA